MGIGEIWNLIILSPVINVLIMLSDYLFSSFGITIIVLTIAVRAVMYPMTRRQLRSMKAMQSIQPKIAELQKKYAKDRQKLAQEQMKLYKESGMNPAGCLLPMLIQMPVWIALYQSIIRVLAVAPEDFLNLSQRLYASWPAVFSLVPLESSFLWLNLAVPDPILILPILVGGSMWVTQRMTMSRTADPRQQAQSQMMLYMMPLMFAFFTLQFPSGLALYWVVSNVIQIVMQYFISGWGGLVPSAAEKKDARDKRGGGRVVRQKEPLQEEDVSADIVIPSSTQEEGLSDGKSGDKREDRGGSYSARLRPTRRQSGRGGSRRPKRR